MIRLRRWSVELLIAAAIFWGVTLWQQRDLLDGAEMAPMFELPLLHFSTNRSAIQSPSSNAKNSIRSIYPQSQRSLIYFFAPWCSVCKLSMGNLSSLKEQLPVIAVALDYADKKAVSDFISDLNIDVPVLLGNSAVAQAYKIKAFPTYYIIDAEGKITMSSMGYSSELGMKIRSSL